MDTSSKEWQILEKVALESFKEQRRSRRWGIFFKLLTFIYIFAAISLFVAGKDDIAGLGGDETHTALVRIHGPIMAEADASANMIVGGLRDAFENDNAKAVLLAINSPGGSPVHAGYVYDEIQRLKAIYPDKKVYAVISDLGASAAYYIAAAADEIYADKASLVGSIGVISASFGFDRVMDKMGVDRRVITAGANKAFLDPYQPAKESDKVFWQKSLEIIHQQFITQVKNGRGDRLKESDDLFSGLIWSGEQALEMGLIDGLGSAGFVARDVIGAEDIIDYSVQRDPFEAFIKKMGLQAGASFAAGLMQQAHISASSPVIR
ncbi:MAG: S49 family peptidase [Pseudomonadales bacterium]|nr:S49 family peptidase [Pseudomonadales bacterium]